MAKKSKKADVSRALESAGALCLAFANSGVPRRDDRRKGSQAPPSLPLERYAELVAWSLRMGAMTAAEGKRLRRLAAERPQDAAAVCARAVPLRAAVIRVFTALACGREPRSDDLAVINGALHLRRAVPEGGGFGWQWAGDDVTFELPLWAVAQSAADLLVSGERAFVRQCGATGCRQLFISRSRRRFWCDMNTCGNRAKGRRQRKFEGYARAAALSGKPAAGSGATSSSGAARETENDEHPTPLSAQGRLVVEQPTERGTPERLVEEQPTVLGNPKRLVALGTAEREQEEGSDAAQPTVREL